MAILAEQRSVLSDISERSSTSGLPRRSNSTRALKSSTYEDNFNFAFSFYQPMIDYLDKKAVGDSDGTSTSLHSKSSSRKEPLPRLRFLEEQSLEPKSGGGSDGAGPSKSRSMVRSYTERDLKTLIAQATLKESSKRTTDEVSGGGGITRAKQYGYGSGSRGRTVTFSDNREIPSSSLSSFPSGMKLGVSKSTLSRSASDLASNSGGCSTPTPATHYSLTKESIKASLLSKSQAVDEITSKLAESKRRLAQERERESRWNNRTAGGVDDDDAHDGRHFSTLQRSHSFGAYTKKAKKVVESEMAFKAVVERMAGNYPFEARSISSAEVAAAAQGSTSITELHTPMNLQSSRRASASSVGKHSRFSSTKTGNSRTSSGGDDDNNKMMTSNARSAPPSPVRFSVTFDGNREADCEYWKDLW